MSDYALAIVGPKTWGYAHAVADSCVADYHNGRALDLFIQSLGYVFTCGSCRTHYREMFHSKLPYSARATPEQWLHAAHNNVNGDLQKPHFQFERLHRELCEKRYLKEFAHPSRCISGGSVSFEPPLGKTYLASQDSLRRHLAHTHKALELWAEISTAFFEICSTDGDTTEHTHLPSELVELSHIVTSDPAGPCADRFGWYLVYLWASTTNSESLYASLLDGLDPHTRSVILSKFGTNPFSSCIRHVLNMDKREFAEKFAQVDPSSVLRDEPDIGPDGQTLHERFGYRAHRTRLPVRARVHRGPIAMSEIFSGIRDRTELQRLWSVVFKCIDLVNLELRHSIQDIDNSARVYIDTVPYVTSSASVASAPATLSQPVAPSSTSTLQVQAPSVQKTQSKATNTTSWQILVIVVIGLAAVAFFTLQKTSKSEKR